MPPPPAAMLVRELPVGGTEKPANWIPLPKAYLREARKLRVITVGAGFSGLMLAYKIQHEMELEDIIDHQIYEKNAGVGGTWYENHYPGAACDVPAHMYTFPWAPNPSWSAYYASAPEILEYIQRITEKYNLEKNIQFETKLIESVWNDATGKWNIKVEKDGKVVDDECDVFVDATGILNKWTWPSIDGLHSFKGHLVHSARWDDKFDCTDKRVAVIGNGSSALQIVPSLAKKLGEKGHLHNFIRSPTWVSAGFLAQFAKGPYGSNYKYSDEEKKEFETNPEKYLEYRRTLEHNFNKFFYVLLKDSPEQKGALAAYTAMMRERLQNDPVLCAKMIPDFPVGCRRLSPGEGYLECLLQSNVTAEFESIAKITPKGIVTTDGREIELDAIVCATGFDVSFAPPWKSIGKDGYDLTKEWSVFPKGYMSIHAEKMPNYFLFNGPNACAGHGSLLAVMDWTAAYVAKWCQKIATEDIKSATVKACVVDDWNVWAQEVLKTVVWTGGCTSWYKGNHSTGADNEPVTAMYPGSVIHYKELLENIRGEDFEYEYRSNNMFKFMGNGMAQLEKRGEDLSFYVV